MALFEDDAGPKGNAHEFSVSEISGAVKRILEGEFGHVRVRGEVGRTMLARTGHLYFDLKDDRSVIACVSWKGQVARLAHKPEEGMEVVVTGRMTTYGPQSKYQLNVEAVEPAGAGALMAMLEKRKKTLEAEGLFAVERKKPLPYLPEVIGVVTSPSGAVIRDILHRLRDRFPRRVLLWPVAVQGRDCAPQVTAAINGFNRLVPGGAIPRPDLLIVARGGGSIEDLWGFNEESVARAAAGSDIPLISAVGHETDTTLIDYVSDKRAPTPTAAAELAVPVRLELLAWVSDAGARLDNALVQTVTRRKQRLADVSRALPRPVQLLEQPRQRLDRMNERLPAALRLVVQRRRLGLGEKGGAIRPGLLAAFMRRSRDRFQAVSGRLDAGLINRDNARRRNELDTRTTRLEAATQQILRQRRQALEAVERLRKTLGYRQTLKRGYAVVRGDGDVVTRQADAAKAKAIEIEFSDGRFALGDDAHTQKPAKPASRKPKKPDPDQGSLL